MDKKKVFICECTLLSSTVVILVEVLLLRDQGGIIMAPELHQALSKCSRPTSSPSSGI